MLLFIISTSSSGISYLSSGVVLPEPLSGGRTGASSLAFSLTINVLVAVTVLLNLSVAEYVKV